MSNRRTSNGKSSSLSGSNSRAGNKNIVKDAEVRAQAEPGGSSSSDLDLDNVTGKLASFTVGTQDSEDSESDAGGNSEGADEIGNSIEANDS